MTNTPTTPKKTVRFAEKLVSAAHEPKVYEPPLKDTKRTKSKKGPKNERGGNEPKESSEKIDFSALDFEDPRRIWAEIKLSLSVPLETTPAPGEEKDKAKDPKIKKDKSDRKKDPKAEKKKSSSRNEDTKGEKEKFLSRNKNLEAEKTEPLTQSDALEIEKAKPSTTTEVKAKTPNSNSNTASPQQEGLKNPTANPIIPGTFPTGEEEDTPNFNAVSRKTYGINTYPMDTGYNPPTDQCRIAAGEERGYQLGNWGEDVPYAIGEKERSERLGFEYGSENWKRERTAYAKVWGPVDEAEAKQKQ